MAKQIEDTKTQDMLGEPKRRGRPATGQAKDAATRKALQRDRDRNAMSEAIRNPTAAQERVLLAMISTSWLPDSARAIAWQELGRRKGWNLLPWHLFPAS